MIYSGRFAPSPSGPLHFGSLVTALASFLDCKSKNGRWWLRIEDIDKLRVKTDSSEIIKKQLRDHGLVWDYWPDTQGGIDGVLYQHPRHHYYLENLHKLINLNKVFGCSCSRKYLKLTARKLEYSNLHYPGFCRDLNLSALDQYISWRFKSVLNNDFVLRRADGTWNYLFVVVLDDHFQNITSVVRGSDLCTTIRQNRELQTALGLSFPTILHVPIVKSTNGRKLSKRDENANLRGGIYIRKQIVSAWQYLQKNMPHTWLAGVEGIFRKNFY
jgi:glutamyl-Q tRNA(Asp) synthetase